MSPRRGRAPSPVALRSPYVWRFMAAYFDRYFRRHMGALRLARWGRPEVVEGPLVVYMNHPGWWDGALIVLLGAKLFPEREVYCPIDAVMLAKYRVFARMGGFGIALDRPSGAADFLATAAEILARPGSALWVTAQGRFRDVRERPLGVKAGIGRLAELAPDATFLPLAVEYAFWDERGAEALAAFGAPLSGRALAALPRTERLARLEAALTTTLDRLAEDAQAREPERFVPLLTGRAGIGGVYDHWRRLAATWRGERFDPSHGGAPSHGGSPSPGGVDPR